MLVWPLPCIPGVHLETEIMNVTDDTCLPPIFRFQETVTRRLMMLIPTPHGWVQEYSERWPF